VKLGAEFDERGRSAEVARDLFFQAIQKCAHKVLADLREDVFSSFQEKDPEPLPSVQNLMSDLRSGRLHRFSAFPFRLDEWRLHAHTRSKLSDWGTRWRLTMPWCEERAAYTMLLWRREPELAGERWALAGEPSIRIGGLNFDERAFVFRDYGWDPTAEPWSDARTRIRAAFAIALKAFQRDQEQLAHQRGARRARSKHGAEHFDWLAYYQVRGWSYEQILDEYDRFERKTIEEGVKDAAKLVGLQLRAARRGRPRGVPERKPRHLSEAGIGRRRKGRI
jgi:hypothetical protein